MLILSRRVGQKIMIGNDIEIVVHSIRGTKRVRLGIEAQSYKIVRQELAGSLARRSEEGKTGN